MEEQQQPEPPVTVSAEPQRAHTESRRAHTGPRSEEPKEPNRFKMYIQECTRVLKVTKKPTMQEFKTIVKVSGLGILIIGILGFAINLIKEIFLR